MLANTKLTGKELFDMIMKENKELHDERRQGWIFETLCQILIILKCIENINHLVKTKMLKVTAILVHWLIVKHKQLASCVEQFC